MTKNPHIPPPSKERGVSRTGFTIAGYPFARFGVPTIIHAKRATLTKSGWQGTDTDCGGLMKAVKLWVNDLPTGYEVAIAFECQECKYTDAIRIPYSGHKQLFNSTSNRTWSLREGPPR